MQDFNILNFNSIICSLFVSFIIWMLFGLLAPVKKKFIRFIPHFIIIPFSVAEIRVNQTPVSYSLLFSVH